MWGTVASIASMVVHPINTVTGLAHVVANPIQTAKALGKVISNTYNEFLNGNGDVKAGILSHAVGDIAQLFIGTGEAKAATELLTVVEDVGKVEELGIVHERLNLGTGERYIGQSKSASRYLERQAEHDTDLGVTHKYNELGRARPRQDLNVLEETHIRLGGGPMKKGGKLANNRYQMNYIKYKAAGGRAVKPT